MEAWTHQNPVQNRHFQDFGMLDQSQSESLLATFAGRSLLARRELGIIAP